MRKTYVKPVMSAEDFLPNVYCNACNTQQIYNVVPICAIPGVNTDKIGDYGSGTGQSKAIANNPNGDASFTVMINGNSYTYDGASTIGRKHGSCGSETGTIQAYGTTGKEPNGQSIYGLVIGDEVSKGATLGGTVSNNGWGNVEVNKYYAATWMSNDDTDHDGVGYNYSHYGAIYVNGVSWSFS